METILFLDRWILSALYSAKNALSDRWMPVITGLGNNGLVWIAIALALLMTKKWRRQGAAVLTALALGFLLANCLLKPLMARPRPFDTWPGLLPLLIPAPADFSFPSAHTLSSFAAAGVLCGMGKGWAAVSLTLATLIALSRLYLLVHYPSDVAAGVLLGLLCAYAARRLVPGPGGAKKKQKKRKAS